MTIDCNLIRKYAKVCDRFKDSNQPVFDSIKLDFANQRAIFGCQRGFGTIKMPVTGYDGTKKPFLVNLSSFLSVINEFPVLELDSGFTFKSGADNEFEISHLDDDYDYPAIELGASAKAFSCGKELINSIKRAGLYTDPDGTASLNGVFLMDGSVMGTDKSRLCEEHNAAPKGVDINLPRAVWETLALEVLGDNLKIDDSNKGSFVVSNGDEITLMFAVNSELAPPPVKDPRFVAKYSHATYIKVSRLELLALATFMTPFVASCVATRMQFIVSGKELELKTEDNGQRISRKLALVDAVGTFNGEKIWVSNTWLKSILSSLTGDVITIQVDPAAAPLNFFSDSNPDLHIVYSKLSEVV